MKKIFSSVLCAAIFAAQAEVEPVTVGTVGVTAIESSAKNTVVAISYQDLAGGGDIKVADIVKTTNLTDGDRLRVYQGSAYSEWTLVEAAGVKTWQAPTATFALQGDGQLDQGTGTPAAEATQNVGNGIWLIRGEKWDGNEFTFYIYGQPASSSTSVVAAGTAALIGNPKQTPVTLDGSKISGVTAGDRIHVPQADGSFKVYTYGTSGWFTYDAAKSLYVSQDPSILAGTGCWYISKGPVTIAW